MTTSYNGWPAGPAAAIGVAAFSVNGVPFPGGVKAGDVATVFRYLVDQYSRRVEKLVSPGCWGYSYKASANDANLISCHASGTAIDINAPRHPNGRATSATFSPAQIAAVHAILAELGGVVHWGGDGWGAGSTIDSMHFEIAEGATAAQVAAVARKVSGAKPAPAPAPRPPAPAQSPDPKANPVAFQRWYNAYPFSPALLPIIKPLANNWGPQSDAALRKVQARYGLAADGIPGPKTRALLYRLGYRG